MAVDDRRVGSMSGLTEEEAKEFHGGFFTAALVFTGIAVVAHLLTWMWKPWIPTGPGGTYSSLQDAVTVASTYLTPFIG